jgi:cobalt-zinc-cadmium resistance protein CzcA
MELRNGATRSWSFLKDRYRNALKWAIENRWITVGAGIAAVAVSMFLAFSGIIGSEFLPHLDEGAIWARGSLANSTSLTEGKRFTDQARIIFASFPEVKTVVSQAAGPTTGPTRAASAIRSTLLT